MSRKSSTTPSHRYAPYTRAVRHPPASNWDPQHSQTSGTLLHTAADPVAGCLPTSPFLGSPPYSATQPPISIHHLQASMYQVHSVSQQPTHHALSPPHPGLFLPSPATNVPYFQQPAGLAWHQFPLGPYPTHSLPNSQPQPLSTIPRSEDSVKLNRAVHQPFWDRQASTVRQPEQLHHGMFGGSHNFSVNNSTLINHNTTLDTFMKEFLPHTLIGAGPDSSARYPPPRCHPGTRLDIVKRCKAFIVERNSEQKMRWVVGPAGVGKSAIMQIVAEETPADASVFLSINGRHDGTKTFATIAYQLAAKYEPYRLYISKEINRDPSLLEKSLPAQFHKFIVDPFIYQHLFDLSVRYLIIIDGLDECDDPSTQRELLDLISTFCLSYQTSPVRWFVTSRPEPHITSFFDDDRVMPAYIKEELMIDSDEASTDVQLYLSDELKKIKSVYPTLKHKREWPSDLQFTQIAAAAGGLFAYASTILRYIGDHHRGEPVSQLDDVLALINARSGDETLGRSNPLALLDALYERIISKIPDGAMLNTRKLLLVYSNYTSFPQNNFRKQCNRLGLTEDAAYGAVRHLHAVMKIPAPHEADDKPLTYFHKSFRDFLFDFKRSKLFNNIPTEVGSLLSESSLRIVEQVFDNSDLITLNESVKCGDYGYLKSGPGFCDQVSLSWPCDDRFRITDHQLRLKLYLETMADLSKSFRLSSKPFCTIPFFHILTKRFTAFGPYFPIDSVRYFIFNDFRSTLTSLGKLKQVPLRTLDYAAICGWIDLRYTSPVGSGEKYSDTWNPICEHLWCEEEHTDDSLQKWKGWTTTFERYLDEPGDIALNLDIPRFHIKSGKDVHWKCVLGIGDKCLYCLERLARYFISNPDQLATVFVDSTEMCYVEVSFVDPNDGISEWRYQFYHSGAPLCV